MPEIDSPPQAGARAAVLARLWGALAREPLPGLTGRRVDGDTLVVTVAGHRVDGPAALARPFAVAPAGFTVGGTGDPATLARRLFGSDGFAAELDNSVANLALARARPTEPRPTDPRPTDPCRTLVDWEQSIVDGHPLHPCCRTRLGFSADDVLAYAPEHHPVVRLRAVRVPDDRWYGPAPPVLLMHPWQYEHLLPRHPWLRPAGPDVPAHPLASLRTLARVDDPGRHVKTALSVQMTSAVRTVSPAALHNGPVLSALLATLSDRVPGLAVAAEDGGGAVLVDGEPDRALSVLYRRMPALGPDETALPLAALGGAGAAADLVTTAYGGDALSCVDGLAGLILPPLLHLLRLGVALEAHGQNLLLVLRAGRPHRLIYRDFGGVRVSPRRLRAHGLAVPPLRGDIVSDDPDVLRTKLFASAVVTVLGELIAVLSRELGMDEDTAWSRVAAHARAGDATDVAALGAATLPVKAMTAMRLAADPLTDIWAALPNPLAGLRA